MKLRKLFAFALSAALLAGCSGGSSSGGGGETPSSGGEASGPAEIPTSDVFKGETNQQTYPLSDEKITLTYWYPHGNSIGTLNDYNDSEFFQWMEEKTNVHIEFVVPAVGEETTPSTSSSFQKICLTFCIHSRPARNTVTVWMRQLKTAML